MTSLRTARTKGAASLLAVTSVVACLWACGSHDAATSGSGNGPLDTSSTNGANAPSGASSGASASTAGEASSPSGAATSGAPSSGHGGGASSSRAGSSASSGSPAADGGGPHDASAPPDASHGGGGDSGSESAPGAPYKGVANSACGDLTTLGVSWYYNWETSPGTCKASTFIPMVWGHTGTEQTASGISQEVASLVSGGYDTVLGFNEPDNSSQSNIDVATAITLWPSFDNPAVLLGSPATQANSTGQTWFTSFMDQVNADTTGTLRVDFIAAHWYGWNSGSCDAKASTLESYINWLEQIPGNRPIWLTEWGCLNDSNPSEAVVQAFFSGALTMLAKHPRVVRYAWYPWTTNNELVGDAGLTSLGEVFAAAPSTH